MLKLIEFLLDIIFPPSVEELRLRGLSPFDLLSLAQKSPTTPFPFITSIFAYKDPLVSELIWQIKSKKNKHAIECGSLALYDKLKKEKTILIPIPISNKRRRERGYNQCEILIEGIIRLDSGKFFEKRYDILSRKKHSSTKQAFKNRKERLESVGSIFYADKVNSEYPIVIIDDVTTTGSTAIEARQVLIDSGYSNVRVLTLAH